MEANAKAVGLNDMEECVLVHGELPASYSLDENE